MDIHKYLRKSYIYPPCWQLVVDVYLHELNWLIKDYQADSDSTLSIAKKFRLELQKGKHGFVKLDKPVDYAVALMSKPGYHCGVYYQGKILHALKNTVIYQDVESLSDHYRHMEYWDYGQH